MTNETNIGMLLYPGMTQLDLTGPYEVFAHMEGARIHLCWRDLAPVRVDGGLSLLPSTTFRDCPPLEVLFVPGGGGQVALMDDAEVLSFLRARAAPPALVTAACTGSLLLGAAGLLAGYRATTHWGFTDLLPIFGATFVKGRVVVDRDRITGGGVTAGIDMALTAVA